MRFYRALLRAYPASFRAEYGDEMCAIHAQKMRNANALWISILAVFDVFYDAFCVHLDILRQDLRYAAQEEAHRAATAQPGADGDAERRQDHSRAG